MHEDLATGRKPSVGQTQITDKKKPYVICAVCEKPNGKGEIDLVKLREGDKKYPGFFHRSCGNKKKNENSSFYYQELSDKDKVMLEGLPGAESLSMQGCLRTLGTLKGNLQNVFLTTSKLLDDAPQSSEVEAEKKEIPRLTHILDKEKPNSLEVPYLPGADEKAVDTYKDSNWKNKDKKQSKLRYAAPGASAAGVVAVVGATTEIATTVLVSEAALLSSATLTSAGAAGYAGGVAALSNPVGWAVIGVGLTGGLMWRYGSRSSRGFKYSTRKAFEAYKLGKYPEAEKYLKGEFEESYRVTRMMRYYFSAQEDYAFAHLVRAVNATQRHKEGKDDHPKDTSMAYSEFKLAYDDAVAMPEKEAAEARKSLRLISLIGMISLLSPASSGPKPIEKNEEFIEEKRRTDLLKENIDIMTEEFPLVLQEYFEQIHDYIRYVITQMEEKKAAFLEDTSILNFIILADAHLFRHFEYKNKKNSGSLLEATIYCMQAVLLEFLKDKKLGIPEDYEKLICRQGKVDYDSKLPQEERLTRLAAIKVNMAEEVIKNLPKFDEGASKNVRDTLTELINILSPSNNDTKDTHGEKVTDSSTSSEKENSRGYSKRNN